MPVLAAGSPSQPSPQPQPQPQLNLGLGALTTPAPGVDPYQQLANATAFTRTWQGRMPTYQGMGFSATDLQPAMRWDAAHVNTTGSLLTESQVMAIAMAAHTGQPYAEQKKPGLIAEIRSDASALLRNIPSIPANLLIKEPARINAILSGRWNPQIEQQGWWQDLQDMVKHPFFTNPHVSSAEIKSMEDTYGSDWISNIPGLRDLPGFSTATSLLLGGKKGLQDLQAHPVNTLLDVFPYLKEALGPVADLPLPEALKPLAKFAAEPAARDIGELPGTVGQTLRSLAEKPLAKLPMGGFTRATRKLSRDVNLEGAIARKDWSTASAAWMDKLAQALPESAREEFLNDTGARRELTQAVQGVAPTTIPELTKAFLDPGYKVPSPSIAVQAAGEVMRDLARQVERRGIGDGTLIQVDFIDPQFNGSTYSITSPAGKAIQKYYAKEAAEEAGDKDKAALIKTLKKYPPAAYTPAVNAIARKLLGLKTGVNEMVIPELETMDPLQGATKLAGVRRVIRAGIKKTKEAGEELDPAQLVNDLRGPIWNATLKGVAKEWTKIRDVMKESGYEPPWIHEAAPEKVGKGPVLIPGSEMNPNMMRTRSLDVRGSYIPDLQVAVTDSVRQMVEQDHMAQLALKIQSHHARPLQEVFQKYRETYPTLDPVHLEAKIRKAWSTWDPEAFFKKKIRAPEGMVIPNTVKAALDAMAPRSGGKWLSMSPLIRGLWVTSILGLSPAYLAHIVGGSANLLLAETGPGVLKYLGQAWDMAKEKDIPTEISLAHLGTDVPGMNEAIAYWSGRTYGRILDTIYKISSPSRHVADFVERMYKSMAYLYGEGKALRAGLDPARAADEGVRLANNVLHDFYAMTPIEQRIVREIFPFYGWMKTLWSYTLRYPIDHPVRIAVAGNVTKVIDQERDHRLNETWDELFRIGSPIGGPFGKVKVLDISGINPFNTVANMFTWAGVLSHLNPAIHEALSVAGFVPAQQAEMFPNLSYDPVSGNLVAQQPGVGGQLANLISVFPQLDAAAIALKLTDQSRQLALSDPQAWQQQIWQKLIPLPFAMTPVGPEQKDFGAAVAKNEKDRLTVLNTGLENAIKTNDLHLAQSFFPNLPGPVFDQMRAVYYLPKLTGGKTVSGSDFVAWLKAQGLG